MTDTKRSVLDPDQEYVRRDESGTIVPTEKSYLSSLSPTKYYISIRKVKFDTRKSLRFLTNMFAYDMSRK